MLSGIKRLWNKAKSSDSRATGSSLLLQVFLIMLEDVLFWKKMWLSLYVLFLFHVVFIVCVYQQIHFIPFLLCFCVAVTCMDGIEAWFRYKHRTKWLKEMASEDAPKLKNAVCQCKMWIKKKYLDILHLRDVNSTKAYLLGNIVLGSLFVIGRYINGYLLIYFLFMSIIFINKWAPPLIRLVRRLKQNAESDYELEGLLPDASDMDIKLLSIEPELDMMEERQSLDWKPEELPFDESSDSSSENSNSLVENLSAEKMQVLEKEVETSDSSEDEYIPLVQPKEQLYTTLEVAPPSSTWSNSAYSVFRNLTGAVANLVYTSPEQTKKKRLSSRDSSDGFEIINQNDLQ